MALKELLHAPYILKTGASSSDAVQFLPSHTFLMVLPFLNVSSKYLRRQLDIFEYHN